MSGYKEFVIALRGYTLGNRKAYNYKIKKISTFRKKRRVLVIYNLYVFKTTRMDLQTSATSR